MKKWFLIAVLLVSQLSFGQRGGITKTLPLTVNSNNLLDAPGFRRAAIAFVPFADGPEARRRGYKPDSVYVWVDPAGKRKRATGKQILDELNQVEKALCERGHSLRQRNTFEGLSYTLPRNISPNALLNVNKLNFGGYLYAYTGTVNRSNEFPGMLSSATIIERLPNDATMLSVPLTLSVMPETMNQLGSCTMDIYRYPNKKGAPLFSVPVNIKSPASSRGWSNALSINGETFVPPQKEKYWLYSYPVTFRNDNNKIPAAGRNHDYYFVTFRFTDTKGKQLILSSQNDIVLDNTLVPPINIPVNKSNSINSFNFEVTDPIKNAFGFYARSSGFTASTSSNPFGYKGIDKKSSFTADISIGAKYYNFEHLVNNSAPVSKELEIIGANFSASQSYYRPDQDNLPPPIRIPGQQDLMKDKNTQLQFRILGEAIDGNSKQITQDVFNQRFFIGPVPCRATIRLQGSAGISANGTYTGNTCDMKGTVTPAANISVVGEGGVDAFVAYAIVQVNVSLLNVSMPINFDIENASKAAVSSAITVSGLSGAVNFKAGFCIPIPFFDDICKDFTIEIFRWDGLNKTYNVDNAGIK